MVPPVLVNYLLSFWLSYLVYFFHFIVLPACVSVYHSRFLQCHHNRPNQRGIFRKHKPPDTRNESWVSKLCVSCPAMGERHWDHVRRIYSSDPHTSPQPSSSYEDTYVSFMEPFSEWNCCNVIDAPTIKRRSPDTVQTSLSSSDTFVFPLRLPAFSELFKFTPQMNSLANECLGCLID